MYRSEIIYKNTLSEPFPYAVCVPSYDRPNNAFIKWVSSPSFDVPRENLFMFIRNTEEQKLLYRPLKQFVRLILLPDWVTDIGDTRKAIIEWGSKHSPDILFMLDDRVKGLWYLSPIQRSSGVYLDPAKNSSPLGALKVWAYEHLTNNMVSTSISTKGFHWMSDRIGMPIKPLNGGVMACCVAHSPKRLLSEGVNYNTIAKFGIEDTYILHQLLTKKLPFCSLSDICFDQVPTNNQGGNASVSPGMTREDRLLIAKKLFWEKTLGIPWGTRHPGYYTVSTKVEPDQIRINYPFWRKYYADTE